MKRTIENILYLLITILLLTGCSFGDKKESSYSEETLFSDDYLPPIDSRELKVGKGVYLDSPVEGLGYECGELNGFTDANGTFKYQLGLSCVFKVGALIIREIPGEKLEKDGVVIQETNPKVAQLLLSIDKNTDSKKIKIESSVVKEFQDSYYKKHINDVDINELIKHMRLSFDKKGIALELRDDITLEDAKKHLLSSYKKNLIRDGFTPLDEKNRPLLALDDNYHQIVEDKPQFSGDNNRDVFADRGTINSNNTKGKSSTKIGAGDNDKSSKTQFTENSSTDKETLVNLTQEDRNSQKETVEVAKNEIESNEGASGYSYIPRGESLTRAMIFKFLNMATFGATDELVDEVKEKGVVAWVEEQLNMEFNERNESILRGMIKNLTTINRGYYSKKPVNIDEWLKDDNGLYFNQGKRLGPDELKFHYSKVFDEHLRFKDQLRQRVAYALSQIIVVSQSNDRFFTDHGEALSYYYDILLKRAFGNYSELLYDISMSPAMATFLTFAGNRKEYQDPTTGATILPDENYGREIMQLFTIGLYKLNIDGTEKRDSDGKRVPTYEQEDVNNLSRVFTGLSYPHAEFGVSINKGDTTHPLKCFMEYHDTEEKEVLGETLPAGQNCEQDVRSAIDLLTKNDNIAPFIAKKLILRLTKSNPKVDYIKRVAETFSDTQGDLKETIKAILLDPEIWENIKSDRGIKIREPYLALTAILRAVDMKPLPVTVWKNSVGKKVRLESNEFFASSLYNSLGGWVTQSPSVFNFYEDDFVPDDSEFKIRGFVAPELEIITSKYNVAFNNKLRDILLYHAVPVRFTEVGKKPEDDPTLYSQSGIKGYIDYKEILEVFRKGGFGEELNQGAKDLETKREVASKLIDFISQKLLGRELDDGKRGILIEKFKNKKWFDRGVLTLSYMEKTLIVNWVINAILEISHTDDFMVQ